MRAFYERIAPDQKPPLWAFLRYAARGEAMEPYTEIQFASIEVAVALGLLMRIRALIEALWISGRLRQIVGSPEGMAAVSAYEDARTDAERQVRAALGRGDTSLAVRVRTPESVAPLAIAFARMFLAMGSDKDIMATVDAEPLSPDDLRVLTMHLDHAESQLGAKAEPPV